MSFGFIANIRILPHICVHFRCHLEGKISLSALHVEVL